MKNKLKIILWIIIAIIFLIIYSVFIDKKNNNNLEVVKPLKISDELISKKYNNVLSEIKTIKDISKCNNIEQKNLSEMCIDIIKDKFSQNRNFTKLDECNKIYTGSTENQKQILDVCRYNVALSNTKSKDDIFKCDKIWNDTFANMCKDIIKEKYK